MIAEFKNGAIPSTEIDWDNFEKEVRKSFESSKVAGIEKALTLYGNKHTFYRYQGQTLSGDIPYEASKSECYYSPDTIFQQNQDGIGYLVVPGLGLSPKLSKEELQIKATQYVQKITDEIIAQDQTEKLGWVIDLRENSGGNMWPMLLALRPFFTQEMLGYFIRGENTYAWKFKDGDIINGWNSSKKRFLNKAIDYQLKNHSRKIAVLVGRKTSSSGEATAIALGSIEGMKYFGDHTSGYSTANQSIKMGEDEYLILTTSVMADHQKNEIWEGLHIEKVICEEQELFQSVLAWMKE